MLGNTLQNPGKYIHKEIRDLKPWDIYPQTEHPEKHTHKHLGISHPGTNNKKQTRDLKSLIIYTKRSELSHLGTYSDKMFTDLTCWEICTETDQKPHILEHTLKQITDIKSCKIQPINQS